MLHVDELIQKLESNSAEHQLDLIAQICIVVSFGLLSAVGLVANSVMIVILLRMKQTIFNTIILGLCFTDLISSCITPFTIYHLLRMMDFALPPLMCNLITTVDTATTMVTVHHVLLLSIIRYQGIIHAFDAQWEVSVKTCRMLLAGSWILSFTLLAFPQFMQMEVKPWTNGTICIMNFNPAIWIQVLSVLSVTLGILVPTIMIVGLCVAIVHHLIMRRTSTTVRQGSASKQKEDRVLLQLKAIVLSFLVGYSIDYASKILVLTLRGTLQGVLVKLTLLIPSGILRFTECLNPFLYYYASEEIREYAKRLKKDLQKAFKWKRTSPAPEMTDAGAVETGLASGTRTAKIAWTEQISR